MHARETAGWRALACGGVGALLLVVAAWSLRAYTPDDAFISFSFAQRVAAGDGWVASVDTPPVEGFSNPLWVGLLAAAAGTGLDLVMAAKILGLVCGAWLIVATARLAGVVHERPGWSVWIGPLLLATWPPLALWTASGMENALYGMLIVSGTLGVAREVWQERPSARSAWWWVAAMWTRPEAFGLAAVAGVWRLTSWRRDRRATLRWWGIAGVGLAALFAWRYATFGDWLPNTYYAKRSNLLLGRGGLYLWQCAWQAGFGVVAAVAVVPLIARVRRLPGLWHPVWLIASLAAAHATFIVWAGGDWMHQFRFVTPMAPFVAVLAGVGTVHLWGTLRTRVPVGAAAVPLVLAACWLGSLPSAWREVRAERSVDIMSRTWAPYRTTLRAVAATLGPRAGAIVPELGYPSYATDLRILDPLGLASAHVAHLRYERVDHLLRDVWRPDAVKLHSLVREALHLDRDRWFRDGFIPLAAPPDWRTRPAAVDGWYIRRDQVERPAAALPPPRAVFGAALELREAVFDPPAVRPGTTLRLRLAWVPAAAVGDWTYTLYLRTPSGRVVARDRRPLRGWWPTSQWPLGRGIVDHVPLAIDPALPSGTYDVALAVRVAATGAVVPVRTPAAPARPRSEPVPIGRFEIVTSLSPDRLPDLRARVAAREAEGDVHGAWDALAPVRVATDAPADLRRAVARTGERLLVQAFAAAIVAARRGDLARARTLIDRARAVRVPALAEVRVDGARELLLLARNPDAGEGSPPLPSWEQIRLAALALHADPTSREAERFVRRLWRRRVEVERAARVAAGRTWWRRGPGPHAFEFAEEDGDAAPPVATPRALRTPGDVVELRPPLLMDQLAGADIVWQPTPRPGGKAPDRVVLQLGYFGPAGYRVASVELPATGDPDQSVRLACVRVEQRLLLDVSTGGGPPVRYELLSLEPNPWGAPFYPPQTPVLHGIAVLAVGPGAAARAQTISTLTLRIGPSAEFDSGTSQQPAPDTAWLVDPAARPALTEFRAYEVLPRAGG